jgi:citrate lyase beta subunit
MQLNYYIYYRIAPSEAAHARAVVDAVQSALRQDTGIQGRLMRRDDDASTWMEIYENVADAAGFEAALQRLLARHGFDGCLTSDARRHIERFTLF